jgi:hypothetical protein
MPPRTLELTADRASKKLHRAAMRAAHQKTCRREEDKNALDIWNRLWINYPLQSTGDPEAKAEPKVPTLVKWGRSWVCPTCPL